MSTSATPRPLDHLVLPTADLGIARERLSALGFTVAPIGVHPFGTENACVYLSDGTFLEPLVVGDAAKADEAVATKNVFVARDRQFRVRNGEEGLSAIVFGTEDADADHKTFVDAGVSAGDRLDFSRPFKDASGKADMASFRLAFAAETDAPDAFFFTCERANVPQVDRSALQAHANGAKRLASIIACVDDPASHARFFEAVANAPALPAANGVLQVILPNAAIELVDPAAFKADTGLGAPAGNLRLVAIVFGVASLTQTNKILRANVIEFDHRDNRLIVPAAPGQGAIFIFEEL
ncbi:VOC family protein [Pseudaminobacter soli (ex Li et al. 2025)]|uniref:Lactoylglutathione lyase n=1 Tax=Pseudaminobacter soli (ex Li et al. 2025) TaxID=1295366 RepID=A0A2P7SC56_9HYPH|nr:VOC family protein [Mesorhizobium soli]PSJ59911.1 lactoylglutathione lyase [Mesorhizobium soli]